MDQVRHRMEIFDKEARKIPYLSVISDKTHIPPAYFLLAFLAIAIFFLIMGIGSALISRLIGVAYPLYKSIKALETKRENEDKMWLTYWTVYGLFVVVDEFAEPLLIFIPFYFFAKVCFMIWLYNPATNGALVLYTIFFKPLLKRYETKLKDGIELVKEATMEIKNLGGNPKQILK